MGALGVREEGGVMATTSKFFFRKKMLLSLMKRRRNVTGVVLPLAVDIWILGFWRMRLSRLGSKKALWQRETTKQCCVRDIFLCNLLLFPSFSSWSS